MEGNKTQIKVLLIRWPKATPSGIPLPFLFPTALLAGLAVPDSTFLLHVPSCPSCSHSARNGRGSFLGRALGAFRVCSINGLMSVPDTGKGSVVHWFLCHEVGRAVQEGKNIGFRPERQG